MSTTARTGSGAFNLFDLLCEQAERHPGRMAFAQARRRTRSGRFLYETLTYKQLLQEVNLTACALHRAGVHRASKVLLLVRPDLDLPIIVFALFKLGAVPIVIDPAMGLKRLFACVQQVAPHAMIALPFAHALRPFAGKAFASIDVHISTGTHRLPGARRLLDLRREAADSVDTAGTRLHDLAAIFFTSGSTGAPKGVEATHGSLAAQITHFRALSEGDLDGVELAAFPIATLISPCLGRSSVIPDMGSSRPGRCKPEHLIRAIEDFGVTTGFASPIVWDRLSRHCALTGRDLPSLRTAFSGGAPIAPRMADRLMKVMPHGLMHTPYGATEVTPISTIAADEIAGETARLSAVGHGVCVGRVVPGLDVRIIEITEGPLCHWRDVKELPATQVGEIVVRGALVSPRYHNDPVNTALCKIEAEEAGGSWHRTGDAGYFDKRGRLWFCGRTRHIVKVQGVSYHSVSVEEVLNAEAEVWRSALVGVEVAGQTELALVVEFHPEHRDRIGPTRLHTYKARLHGLDFPVKHLMPYPKPFPVDKRHNSKIERHVLAEWAQRQINRGAQT